MPDSHDTYIESFLNPTEIGKDSFDQIATLPEAPISIPTMAATEADRRDNWRAMDDAKQALMTIAVGEQRISEVAARLIVVAIKAGRIPHVGMVL